MPIGGGPHQPYVCFQQSLELLPPVLQPPGPTAPALPRAAGGHLHTGQRPREKSPINQQQSPRRCCRCMGVDGREQLSRGLAFIFNSVKKICLLRDSLPFSRRDVSRKSQQTEPQHRPRCSLWPSHRACASETAAAPETCQGLCRQ